MIRRRGSQSINIGILIQNLLNRANYVGYSGVMTSPFIMQATNIAGPRRVQFQMKFGF